MEGTGDNVFEAEKAPVSFVTLDKVTRAKLIKLPKSRVYHARKSAKSTFMEQMVLSDQMDPRRLKFKSGE